MKHDSADSVAVITRRCQRLNSGSIPDRRIKLLVFLALFSWGDECRVFNDADFLLIDMNSFILSTPAYCRVPFG